MPKKTKRAHSPSPPPREKTAEEIAEDRRIEREAARLCLDAPMLIGVDMPRYGMCAEGMVARGLNDRHGFVWSALFCRVPADILRPLVNGEGEWGSDRLVGVWWSGASSLGVWQVSRGIMTPEAWVAQWFRDVADLHADRMMREDAVEVLRGTADPFWHRRKDALDDVRKFQARMVELAKEEPSAVLGVKDSEIER